MDCREQVPIERKILETLGVGPEHLENPMVYQGQGCKACNNTGYKGRIALYEVMRFDEDLKELVLQGASAAELKLAAIKAGMSTLRSSGILKVLEGTTTPEEILRVTMAD